MEQIPSFNEIIEKSIVNNWERDALSDYKGATLQYHDVARKIEKLHILFENSGIRRGDKIALCGRNSANWAVAFLATLTYGAITVPILHEFTAEQVHNIVNHSEAKLLFVGDVIATTIDGTKMPGLEGIIYIPDYSLVISRTDQLTFAREHLNEMFGKKYPKYFRKEHVHYYVDRNADELAMINYTSGTTGFSKGVMIPYRALWSNFDFALHVLGNKIQWHICMEWLSSSSSSFFRDVISSTSLASRVRPSLHKPLPTSVRLSLLPFHSSLRKLSAKKFSQRFKTTGCVSC